MNVQNMYEYFLIIVSVGYDNFLKQKIEVFSEFWGRLFFWTDFKRKLNCVTLNWPTGLDKPLFISVYYCGRKLVFAVSEVMRQHAASTKRNNNYKLKLLSEIIPEGAEGVATICIIKLLLEHVDQSDASNRLKLFFHIIMALFSNLWKWKHY